MLSAMHQTKLRSALPLWAGTVLTAGTLLAAPIPKLFNTGVDDSGKLLSPNQVDPHYTLVESADVDYPGPNAYTLLDAWPVAPHGPWLAEGPSSRWIAPRAQQGTGNAPGNYTFRTTFDLTGYDPTKARIAGKWTSDNSGLDVILNGTALGISQAGNFGALNDFTIESAFVEGTNTLEFVFNNAGDAVNPAGLRVEMIGTVEVAGEAPRIVTQPVGGTYFAGDDVTLTVVADGTPPLTYQWKRNGTDVSGATEPVLSLTAATPGQSGDYTVVITNGAGSKTSDVVPVTVLELLQGLHNTAMGDDGFLIFDGFTDPHYKLVTNPDDPAVIEPMVQDSTVFPIVDGTWLRNSETSAWIGPRFETSAAAGGDYIYELQVNLTGYDPTSVLISGSWTADNAAEILLNGAPTGVSNPGTFNTLSSFRITSGFLGGVNKLQFKVNNASVGYTGLRVDGLRGGARKGGVSSDPRIVSQPGSSLALVGDTVTLAVVADGTAPFTYQWQRNGSPLTGKTEPTLVLSNITRAEAGDYTLVATNSKGSVTTTPATIQVLERVPGVFGTGVDATAAVLADGEVDPHYRLVVNATDPASQDAYVHDSTIFPINDGTWVRNTEISKWIAPVMNSVTSSGGDYTYQTTFDLTGFDPATAVLLGGWATDNLGMDIKLNGTSLGIQNGAQFGSLTPLQINQGFQAGVNKLEFLVNNADAVSGYTGLRVENLRLGALPAGGTAPTLAVRASGANVEISWPAASTGFTLKYSRALPATSWTAVNAPVKVEGDRNVVTVSHAEAAEFYRLEK